MVGTGQKTTCSVGERAQLVGRLCSQNFWTEDKKIRQKVIIKTGELQVLSKDDNRPDENRVQICSQIASEIQNQSDCSAFTMTTTTVPK